MTDDLVTRYRLREGDMEPSPFGLYVRHDDHAARIEADAATIARLEGERDRQVDLRDDQCRRKLEALSRAEAAEAKLAQAVEVLRPLHDTVVEAFPALANLGPVAAARAFLDSMGGK